jgi:hypothetical protein
MRAIACDTLSRCCARRVFCWSAFPLVPALGSTDSAADGSALFVGLPGPVPPRQDYTSFGWRLRKSRLAPMAPARRLEAPKDLIA